MGSSALHCRGVTTIRTKLRITDQRGILCFEYVDRFSVSKAKECVDVIAETCMARNCRVALLDCRPMSGVMSTMDRFEVAEHAERLRDAGIRVAMVATPDQVGGPVSFAETVARNRGVNVRVFNDVESAFAWLQG